MKILHITNKPIYPKSDGGCVAMEKLVEGLLREGAVVKHITISTEKHQFSIAKYPEKIRNEITPESVFIDTKVSILGALKHLFKKGSYNVSRFHSEEMKQLIINELKSIDYEVVLLESLYCTSYIDDIRSVFNGEILIRIHNIESDIWDGFAKHEKNPVKRAYLKKLANDLRLYEFNILNKVDGILAITDDDKSTLDKEGVTTKRITIPVSIDSTPYKITEYTSNNLFHLGAMNWQPNIEAVQRLLNLFPKIRVQSPTIHLHLAGGNFPSDIRSNNKEHIHVDGFVENPHEFAAKTGILVSPIVSGSGVRIKILEMMAIGIPIITTKLGAQGINHKNCNCLRIADSDEEIIAQINDLVNNKKMREEIGKNAIDYIQKNHSIEVISKKLIEFILST